MTHSFLSPLKAKLKLSKADVRLLMTHVLTINKSTHVWCDCRVICYQEGRLSSFFHFVKIIQYCYESMNTKILPVLALALEREYEFEKNSRLVNYLCLIC